MLVPIMVLVAAFCAFQMYQTFHRMKTAHELNIALDQSIAAHFAGFDALDTAVKKYTAANGGQVPPSLDQAIKSAPELFPADLVQRDASADHNLTHTILLSNVSFAGPGDDNHFQYQWALLLYVPLEALPEGFAKKSDYVRWSGQPSTPGKWAGGFTSAGEATQFFGPAVIDAARAKVQSESAPTTAPTTQPQ
jgi:hypothetical protein